MVKRIQRKPNPVGRPRIPDGCIVNIRKLREEGFSYAWIGYKLNVHRDTARAYCVGRWKDYDPK